MRFSHKHAYGHPLLAGFQYPPSRKLKRILGKMVLPASEIYTPKAPFFRFHIRPKPTITVMDLPVALWLYRNYSHLPHLIIGGIDNEFDLQLISCQFDLTASPCRRMTIWHPHIPDFIQSLEIIHISKPDCHS